MGQGYFNFNLSTKSAWDGITTPGTMKLVNGSLDTAFLVGSSSSTPLISAVASQTATNGTTLYNPVTAWADILSDPNFSLAQYAGSGTNAIATIGNGGGLGSFTGAQFPVNGTSSGTVYNVYVIAWSSAFATPQQAASAGAAVGWSAVLPYSATSAIGSAATFSATATAAGGIGLSQFGVVNVPEPASFALAGLGAAAMLIFRRRK